MKWQARFLDLNPIEHLWFEAEKRLIDRKFQDDLFETLNQAWISIPKSVLEILVELELN